MFKRSNLCFKLITPSALWCWDKLCSIKFIVVKVAPQVIWLQTSAISICLINLQIWKIFFQKKVSHCILSIHWRASINAYEINKRINFYFYWQCCSSKLLLYEKGNWGPEMFKDLPQSTRLMRRCTETQFS